MSAHIFHAIRLSAVDESILTLISEIWASALGLLYLSAPSSAVEVALTTVRDPYDQVELVLTMNVLDNILQRTTSSATMAAATALLTLQHCTSALPPDYQPATLSISSNSLPATPAVPVTIEEVEDVDRKLANPRVLSSTD